MDHKTLLLAAMGLLCPLPASAFCGAYVGAEGEEIHNRASRIVVARDDGLNTLTMFNDFEGDASQFGMIIPVPASIEADNVRLVPPELLDRVDRYSAPRLVQYTCEDFYNDAGTTIDPNVLSPSSQTTAASQRSVSEPGAGLGLDTADTGGLSLSASSGSSSVGCGGGSINTTPYETVDTSDDRLDTAYGVVIEDEFSLGEYELWVLRAEDTAGLTGWLGDNGFVLPGGAEKMLSGYVDGASRFLALRIDTERLPAGQTWLSPLQLRYVSDAWGLPIRLGTLSSGGIQDLIVYALTTYRDGQVGISNYPEAALPEDECMLALDPADPLGDFSDLYEQRWTEAAGVHESSPGLAWTTEYGWGFDPVASGVKCDPCPPPDPDRPSDDPITTPELAELGLWSAEWGGGWYVTRLRLRYTPQSVTRDLMLYPSGISSTRTQMRYIVHRWELESLLPTCGAEPDEPGSCYSSEYWSRAAAGELEPVIETADPSRLACKGSGRSVLVVPLLLAAVAGAGRRRGGVA